MRTGKYITFCIGGKKYNRATLRNAVTIPEVFIVFLILAIIAGLITSILFEAIILKVREHFNWIYALKTAFGMSFISMVGMEIAMNTSDFVFTGGKASFADPLYWIALIIAMIIGFIAPLPYNYYKLVKYDKACH